MMRILMAVLAPLTLASCATPMTSGGPTPPRPIGGPVTVGIVAINDFHGALEPPRQVVRAPDGRGGQIAVPVGGAAWLASAIDSVRANYPHHLTVAAGDLIGARLHQPVRHPLRCNRDRMAWSRFHAVQPFGNTLTTFTLTGAQIKDALEQGLDDTGPQQALTVSTGFSWRIDRSRPSGVRVAAMELSGNPIAMDGTYRVTANSFLFASGDGFTGFGASKDVVIGMTDLEALEAWFAQAPMHEVPMAARVTLLTP